MAVDTEVASLSHIQEEWATLGRDEQKRVRDWFVDTFGAAYLCACGHYKDHHAWGSRRCFEVCECRRVRDWVRS